MNTIIAAAISGSFALIGVIITTIFGSSPDMLWGQKNKYGCLHYVYRGSGDSFATEITTCWTKSTSCEELQSRQPTNQASTVFLQPLSLHPIPRQYLFHFRPEPWGVVEFLAMAQLMHHHIIADVLRA